MMGADRAELVAATARLRDLEEQAVAARAELQELIVDVAGRAERGDQAEIARITGYSRERLRQLVKNPARRARRHDAGRDPGPATPPPPAPSVFDLVAAALAAAAPHAEDPFAYADAVARRGSKIVALVAEDSGVRLDLLRIPRGREHAVQEASTHHTDAAIAAHEAKRHLRMI